MSDLISQIEKARLRFEADHEGMTLRAIEVSATHFDALAKAMRERDIRGLAPGDLPVFTSKEKPFFFEICGVKVSRKKAFVSPAMRDAGALMLDASPKRCSTDLVELIYQEMEAAKARGL